MPRATDANGRETPAWRRTHVRALAAAVLLAALALAPAVIARAGVGDVRTLVVRGRVLAPDSSAVAGARVATRGSATVSAVSDERGRYTLSVPIGSTAGLRRGPFTLEVRAERDGRRLAFGAGAPALAIEVSLAPADGRLLVRSNSPEATTSIASTFSQDDLVTAWVEADFGGPARPGGSIDMHSADEWALAGRPATAPAMRKSARAVRAVRPSLSRDSARTASPAGRSRVAVHPATGVAPAPLVRSAPERPAGAATPARESGVADSCHCSLRGTVEIDWDRPLEKGFPVELVFEGPARQSTQVDMYMGSPREFRLGPLPCGEYRMAVNAPGKWRFTFERGDTVMVVPCRGSAQVRVVLVPAKR